MPETYNELVNRVLRDHEGYTGDGKGGVGELPVGDRSTARKPIDKRDIRQVVLAGEIAVQTAVDAAAAASADAELAQAAMVDAQGATLFAADRAALLANPASSIPADTVFATRAEGFVYQVLAPSSTDHDLTTAGGVKLRYVPGPEGADPRAIGAPANGTDDDAPFVETLFTKHHHVNLASGRTYVFASVIGLPDQTLYADKAYELTGHGATIILDGAAAGDAIITSASAKLNPSSTANLYTGRVNVTGGNYLQRSSSVLLNGDRLYNVIVSGISMKGVTSLIRSYRSKAGGFPNGYMQSVQIKGNHFVQMLKIVDAKKAYNFEFLDNLCEACTGGVYIDGTDTPAVSGFTWDGGLFEGGGLALRLGGVHGGRIANLYLEVNPSGDVVSEKCYIKIGHGGGRSFGVAFDNVQVYPSSAQRADADFVAIKEAGAPVANMTVVNSFFNVARAWEAGKVRTNFNNVIENNSAAGRVATRAPRAAPEAGVSFSASILTGNISAINDAGRVRLAALNVEDMLAIYAANSSARSVSGVIHANVRFMTAGGIHTGGAKFAIDFTAMGAGAAPSGAINDVIAGFELRSAVQIPAGMPLEATYDNVTRAHFTSPTLTVIKSGPEHVLWINGFAVGASLTNYGAATRFTLEVTSEIHGARLQTQDWSPIVRVTT